MTPEPLKVLLDRWRRDLAGWAIPDEISSQVSESPWELPKVHLPLPTPSPPPPPRHHVLYNVPDLEPFVAALTRRARRRVVVEVTARHPLAALNPLWERLHGLRRPEGPTAADVLAILTALGLDVVTATAWTRPATAEFASFAELVEVTRRRLCLPPGRAGELEAALRELGSRPGCHPLQLGAPGRELVTMWWAGTAEHRAS